MSESFKEEEVKAINLLLEGKKKTNLSAIKLSSGSHASFSVLSLFKFQTALIFAESLTVSRLFCQQT